MSINDGGTAFPVGFQGFDQTVHGKAPYIGHTGMSLRAYLSAKALNGIVSNEYLVQTCIAMAAEGRTTPEAVMAQRAIKIADAMIAELAKESK